jgi:hypothetical protein
LWLLRHAITLSLGWPIAQESIPARELGIVASVIYQQAVDKNIHSCGIG